jgi:16S rRNA (guanine527-N7)-methyltransferase
MPAVGHKPGMREAHDLVVARAVAELRVLAELCLPLARVGGHWVAAKGPSPREEAEQAQQAIRKLGGKLPLSGAAAGVDGRGAHGESTTAHAVGAAMVLPVSSGTRTVVVVCKGGVTPTAYPRSPGTPKKSPL